MPIICRCCGRDIDAIGQDNMSENYQPLCEDCYYGRNFEFSEDDCKDYWDYLYDEYEK